MYGSGSGLRKGGIRLSFLAMMVLSAIAVVACGVVASAAESAGTSGKNGRAVAVRDVDLEGSHATFRTEKMIVEVRDGAVARIFNRLTGTEYVTSRVEIVPPEYSTGLVYVVSEAGDARRCVPEPLPASSLTRQTVTRRDAGAVEYAWHSGDGTSVCTVTYSLDPISGALLIHQRGERELGGLSAIRFGVGPITCRGNLLLPVFHGIKANRTDSFYTWEGTYWQWPTGWPLPLVIFDDALGGLWIHTQDTERRFKAMNYHYEGSGAWLVAFDTVNHAPFAPHATVESVTWRLDTYAGDWTVPVDCYKRWAYDAYSIADKAFARPAWVDDLRLVIKRADHIAEDRIEHYLDSLAEYVAPSQTLLFLNHWIEADTPIMPHWKSSERRAKFNREARKRGFRTIYFANYFGITPNHPRFEEFRPYFARDAYTQEVVGWNLKPDPGLGPLGSIKLYYVNPAHRPWRDYQIDEFKTLFEAYPADGLFIDQTFNMYNDGNGMIDGQSMIDANLSFHRELAEALPGVAIGGEGVNEITFQYESVCEFHILSLHVATDEAGRAMGWKLEPDAFDRMVPLMPRFLLPHTRPIGYHVGSAKHPFYGAWRDAIHIYNGIPTISRPTLDEIQDPESEARRVMRDAMFRDER
jgi:hypothetical protein